MRIRAALACALWLAAAAAPAAGAEPDSEPPGATEPAPPGGGPFPTPEQLEQLGEAPTPERLFVLDVLPVERWKLSGPFPARVGAVPFSEPTPWSALLDEAASRRAGLVVPTEAMACVARELGRFYLAHRARPDDGLRNFILTRCHASVTQIGMAYVDGSVPPGSSDEAIFAHYREPAARMLEQTLVGGPSTVGLWFGREGDHAVVLVAYGRRDVHVDPFSPVVGKDRRIEISGESLTPTSRIGALVNQGRFGVAPCEPARDVAPPRFRFTCELARGDEAARISISLTPPGRLLARGGLMVLALSGDSAFDEYRMPRAGKPRTVSGAEEAARGFADLVNQVRKEAGLQRVELDMVQSGAAAELAPHFFAATMAQAPELTADLVVLGMLAGWSVEGLVESGHFAAASVLHSTDLSRLLGAALEDPVRRDALLADDIDRIAVGPIVEKAEDHEAVGAVIGTYSLFSAGDHDELVRRVEKRLEGERKGRGLGAAGRIDGMQGLCAEAARHVQSGQDPADVMAQLVQRSVDVARAPVSGWIAEVSDLELIEFPVEYVTSPTLRVAVSVGYRRPEGEPWGHYVVMLVVSDPEAWGA